VRLIASIHGPFRAVCIVGTGSKGMVPGHHPVQYGRQYFRKSVVPNLSLCVVPNRVTFA
jgi:hypothetical protein